MSTSTYSLYDQVTVRRVAFPRTKAVLATDVPRMRMTPADYRAGTLIIPYAPNEVEHSGIGAEYANVTRAGRRNALVYLKKQLPTMSFTLLVADTWRPSADPVHPKLVQSATSILKELRHWAENGVRIRVTYGAFESGTWRITEMSVKTVARNQTNNEPTRAEVDITFTVVSDIVVGTGPVSGGVKPAPVKKSPAPKTRVHTVKSGDTLIAISIKYYGTGSKWRRIADANKIKNANKLRIGQKLRIP
jgi:LysM repeat protein